MRRTTAPACLRLGSSPGTGLFPRRTAAQQCARRRASWRSIRRPAASTEQAGQPAGQAAGAAAAQASAPPPAAASQRASILESMEVEPFQVVITSSYSVTGACDLSMTGTLDPTRESESALHTAILACLMNLLDERKKALRRAVNYALEHHPGVLPQGCLKRLKIKAGEKVQKGAPVINALDYGDLYSLCKLLAPQVVPDIDAEYGVSIAQELARLKLQKRLDEEGRRRREAAKQQEQQQQQQQEQPTAASPAAGGLDAASNGSSSTAAGTAAAGGGAAANGTGSSSVTDEGLLPPGHPPPQPLAPAASSSGAGSGSAAEGSSDTGANGSAAAAAAGGGSEQHEGEASDKPSKKELELAAWALTDQPLFQEWKKRMRTALLDWARGQPAEAVEASEPPQPSEPSITASESKAEVVDQWALVPEGAAPSTFTFMMSLKTPDYLDLKHRIRVELRGPGAQGFRRFVEGRMLRPAYGQGPSTALKAMRLLGSNLGGLGLLAQLPEEQVVDKLLTLALSSLGLATMDGFRCSFAPLGGAGEAGGGEGGDGGEGSSAASAASGAGGGASQGSSGPPGAAMREGRRFTGSGLELRQLMFTLAWLKGVAFDSSSSSSQGAAALQQGGLGALVGRLFGRRQQPSRAGQWYPPDPLDPSRFRVRQLEGSGGTERYRLQVLPAGWWAAGAKQAKPELDFEISRQQLWALIDCLDTFCEAHPVFSPLKHVDPKPNSQLSQEASQATVPS